MASLTFGSAGDIITVCGIIRTTVKSLSDSRGSAAEYQSLIKELQILSQTVQGVRSLLEKHPHLRRNARLQECLNNCKDYLVQQLELTEPYRAALQQNSTASALKRLCRKIRWLSGKDDRATFRASIASHVLSLSAVLATAGIDVSHEFHNTTIDRLKEGFDEIRLANEQLTSAQDASKVEVKDAIGQSGKDIILRHEDSDRMASIRHEETRTQLEKLQLSIAEQRNLGASSCIEVRSSQDRNAVYIHLICKLLAELSQLGLIGFYHLLQMMQVMLSQASMLILPAAKCLYFQDAILRTFCIDITFMSYQTFIMLIEDNFRNTPGALTILRKQYLFEDKSQKPLNLVAVWSNDILGGKQIFMRAQITTSRDLSQNCPSCGSVNMKCQLSEEIRCICGLRYTNAASGQIVQSSSSVATTHSGPPGDRRSNEPAYKPEDVIKFFKRVQRELEIESRRGINSLTEDEILSIATWDEALKDTVRGYAESTSDINAANHQLLTELQTQVQGIRQRVETMWANHAVKDHRLSEEMAELQGLLREEERKLAVEQGKTGEMIRAGRLIKEVLASGDEHE